MAAIQTHLSVRLLDGLGVTASQPYYFQVDDTNDLATLTTAFQAFITDLDAVTSAKPTEAVLELVIPLPTVKANPATGSEVERGGLFNFLQENIKYKFGVLIPSLSSTFIVNGKINITGALSTFIALFTTIGGDAEPVSTSANALTALSDYLITFRKHRKAESRRSIATE